MKNEDYIVLAEFLNDTEDLSDELKVIAEKLNLIVKQIEISEEYNKQLDDISNKFQELNK